MRTLNGGPRPHPQYDLSHLLPVPRYAHMIASADRGEKTSHRTLPVWYKPRRRMPIVEAGIPLDPAHWVHGAHKPVYGATRGSVSLASVLE